MNDTLKKVLFVVGVLVLGVAIGRYTLPAKIEIKEVEKKVVNKQTDKVYVEVKTTKPDGTVVVEKKLVDKSTTNSTSTTDKNTTKEYAKNQYSIRLMAGTDITNIGSMTYGLGIDKRFIGPITLGLFGFTNKTVGVSLGLNF